MEKERVNILQDIKEAREDKRELRIRLAFATDFQNEWSKGVKRVGVLLKNPLSKKAITDYENKVKPSLEKNRQEAIREEIASGSEQCIVSIPRASLISHEAVTIDSDSDGELQFNKIMFEILFPFMLVLLILMHGMPTKFQVKRGEYSVDLGVSRGRNLSHF